MNTYKFVYSKKSNTKPVFPKEMLCLAAESDKQELKALDFFEEGELERFIPNRSIYILRIKGEYIALGTLLRPYWRDDLIQNDFRDIGMHVSERHRGRGFGRSIVQHLIDICLESGFTPIAECETGNLASRATLESAGFIVST